MVGGQTIGSPALTANELRIVVAARFTRATTILNSLGGGVQE